MQSMCKAEPRVIGRAAGRRQTGPCRVVLAGVAPQNNCSTTCSPKTIQTVISLTVPGGCMRVSMGRVLLLQEFDVAGPEERDDQADGVLP